ncbi:MAG: glycerophosphodiester phosphodiesterase [Sulfolobaceae archaeon]|nr:glycerophosphodiester phosphodiesterase [Sulfolobaceae archaeon]
MVVLIFAHRGASGYAPENTIASFRLAKEMGADGIETDLHMTKDKRIVLIHDETVDRTTNGSGYVRDFTLEEIKKLDAGIKKGERWKGERIPTLEELLEGFSDMYLKLEIKKSSEFYPGIEEQLVKLLIAYGLEDTVQVISFNSESLRKVKEIKKTIATGLITYKNLRESIVQAKKIGADWIHVEYRALNDNIVKLIKREGLLLGVWTVDSPTEAKGLTERYDINDITTNFPDIILRALNRSKGK